MKRSKKWLAVLLSVVLVLGLLPTAALAEEDDETDVPGTEGGSGTALTAESSVLSAGTYYLSDSIVINGGLLTLSSGEATLYLNGHTLTGSIQINTGGTLTLYGGSEDGGSADPDGVLNGGVWVRGGGFTMESGSITGTTSYTAECVCVDGSGTFTMKGGVISNSASRGVTVSTGSTFTMTGGKITGCAALDGGGVFVAGTFIMEDGEISDNTAKKDESYSGNGGGVSIGGGTFNMSGGTITGNTAQGPGGGVSVEGLSSTFNMSGGEISGNTAAPSDDLVYAGGGVYAYGAFNISGSPVINGNTNNSGMSDNLRSGSDQSIPADVSAGLESGADIGLNCGYIPVRPVKVVTGGAEYIDYLHSDDDTCELVAQGNDIYMQPKDSGDLKPNAQITRAQLAERIQQHESFGLSDRTSNSASVFSDVDRLSAAQRNAIGVLYDEKIMSGTGNGTFDPAVGVTRAQAAVIIWRAAGSRSNISPANIPYKDVPGGLWCSAAINCLYAMGVLDRTDMDGNGNFNPNHSVTVGTVDKWLSAYDESFSSGKVGSSTVSGGATRAEMVVQYYNYFKSVISDSKRDRNKQPPFEDIHSCTEEEKEAITFWYQVDVIQGTSTTTFEPYSAASNVQIAAFINNISRALDPVTEQISTWSLLPQNDVPSEDEYYRSLVESLAERGILSANARETIGSNLYAPVLEENLKDWGANTGLAAAAPTFSPESGTVFSGSLSVTIETDTKDAKIYYTTNGSTPTESSSLYSGPITITSTTAIRAIAVNANGMVSGVAAATYTRRVPAPPVDNGSTGGSYYPGSSGGNSGNTGSSTTPAPEPTPTVTTTTTTNPDGSTTTTTTDKATGAVTETTTYPNGAVKVVETTGNGTVTTKETAANGVQVTTVRAPGTAVTASVTIPEGIDAVTVTIAAAVTPGTVAVDTRTGQVIKLSIPTADGLAVKLDHSADFVLTDRSKNFSDTAYHWAKDSVTFVAARELFQGTSTSEPTFEPELPMTRAMLMTVLARLDSAETDGGSIGYEQGMAWAVANGVSDGSNPDGQITREQLATMLWRYASSPISSYVLDQPDMGSISDYAQTAMAWAVEAGILNGYDDGSLRPDATATRAVVATMIQRFCTTLV